MTREQITARLAELQGQATQFSNEMHTAQRELFAVQARILECEFWLEQVPAEPVPADQTEGWSLNGAKS